MSSELTLNQNFKNSLECPICFDFFTPPIYICPNGHSICSTCCTHQQTCPLCRASYEKLCHNRALEYILDQVTIPCKFEGCEQQITLSQRQRHYEQCAFNIYIKCPECENHEEDIVKHLITAHQYKEIIMGQTGGMRSFSGPFESWVSNTDWPKGVWRFGEAAIIVHAKSSNHVFHVFLYRVIQEPIEISLSVTNPTSCIKYRGIVPHIKDYTENSTYQHFNCDVNILLNHFVKMHDDDNDILRLWVTVNRKS